MKKYKSVDEVLRRGQIIVNGPVMLLIVFMPFLSIFLLPKVLPKDYIGIGIMIGFILGFVFGWGWWSYKIVKWRIWAFDNTQEVDWSLLKQLAIAKQLIWTDGSIFEKTEIRTKEDAERIQQINSRIEQLELASKETYSKEGDPLELVKDDPQVPIKTEYSYKRIEVFLNVLLSLFLFLLGIGSASAGEMKLGIVLIGFAIYYADIRKYKDFWKKEVQLSIGEEGIEMRRFKKFGLIAWGDTQDIRVDTSDGVLEIDIWFQDESYEVRLGLNDYTIKDYEEFLRRINVYLKRNVIEGKNS